MTIISVSNLFCMQNNKNIKKNFKNSKNIQESKQHKIVLEAIYYCEKNKKL